MCKTPVTGKAHILKVGEEVEATLIWHFAEAVIRVYAARQIWDQLQRNESSQSRRAVTCS